MSKATLCRPLRLFFRGLVNDENEQDVIPYLPGATAVPSHETQLGKPRQCRHLYSPAIRELIPPGHHESMRYTSDPGSENATCCTSLEQSCRFTGGI
jgi:hypothetical protein